MAVLIDKDRQRTREIVKELLRQIEARPDITKEELLARVGKSAGYLRKSVFKGRIPLDVFLKILRELDMDPADFLAGSDAVCRPWLVGGEGSLVAQRLKADFRYHRQHLPEELKTLHFDVKGSITTEEKKIADQLNELRMSDPHDAAEKVVLAANNCFSAGFACELLSIYASICRVTGQSNLARAAIEYGMQICGMNELNGRKIRFQLQYSSVLFDEGDFTGALEVTADAIVATTCFGPAKLQPYALLSRARILNDIGREDEAGAIAEAMLRQLPQSEPTWIQLAYQLIAYGRLAEGNKIEAEYFADWASVYPPYSILSRACNTLLRAKITENKAEAERLYGNAWKLFLKISPVDTIITLCEKCKVCGVTKDEQKVLLELGEIYGRRSWAAKAALFQLREALATLVPDEIVDRVVVAYKRLRTSAAES